MVPLAKLVKKVNKFCFSADRWVKKVVNSNCQIDQKMASQKKPRPSYMNKKGVHFYVFLDFFVIFSIFFCLDMRHFGNIWSRFCGWFCKNIKNHDFFTCFFCPEMSKKRVKKRHFDQTRWVLTHGPLILRPPFLLISGQKGEKNDVFDKILIYGRKHFFFIFFNFFINFSQKSL